MRGNLTRLLANHCAVRALTSALPPASRGLDRNSGLPRPWLWCSGPWAHRNRRWRSAITASSNRGKRYLHWHFNENIVATDSHPLTLTGVIVNSPGGVAVNAANGVGPVTINADGVTINNTDNGGTALTPGCEYSPAATPPLRQRTPQLDVSGTCGDWAIYAIVLNAQDPSHNASVNFTQGTGLGLISGLDINPSGNEVGAIQADNRGIGNATIVASGCHCHQRRPEFRLWLARSCR